MVGFAPDKLPMWGLGGAGALMVLLIFLACLAIGHNNQTVYPKNDKALEESVHSDQCERPIDKGRIVEVENTLSNIGYIFAGLLILLRVRSWAGHLFGINLVVLGITSGLYHATLVRMPQLLDVAGVYAALLSLSAYAAFIHVQKERPFKVSVWWIPCAVVWVLTALASLALFGLKEFFGFICLTLFVAGIEALCLICRKVLPSFVWVVAPFLLIGVPLWSFLIRYSFVWDSDAVFLMLTVLLIIQLVLIFASAPPPNWRRVGWELPIIAGALLLGLFFRLMDGYAKSGLAGAVVVTRKCLCVPDGIVQSHALWHLLSAAALLLAYDLLSQFQRGEGASADKAVILPDSPAY